MLSLPLGLWRDQSGQEGETLCFGRPPFLHLSTTLFFFFFSLLGNSGQGEE
jgi:hypothetical protein